MSAPGVSGFGGGFETVQGLFFLVFFLILGMIIFQMIKGVAEWSNNNKQPIIPVESKVVAKRVNVTHHHHGGETPTTSTSSTYYVTFEFVNGDRMELKVSGREYGMLVEGDKGILSFQGTRYIGFERR
ncbi:MAG: DUF2500 domain-containing protein [Clostridium sp.]